MSRGRHRSFFDEVSEFYRRRMVAYGIADYPSEKNSSASAHIIRHRLQQSEMCKASISPPTYDWIPQAFELLMVQRTVGMDKGLERL
ncbi:hypothetical protein TNCV_3885431 [Trichonephila clavipes]|nr:hypothetical protein TNCV_3885431 [Trichonephila clavipes]